MQVSNVYIIVEHNNGKEGYYYYYYFFFFQNDESVYSLMPRVGHVQQTKKVNNGVTPF